MNQLYVTDERARFNLGRYKRETLKLDTLTPITQKRVTDKKVYNSNGRQKKSFATMKGV